MAKHRNNKYPIIILPLFLIAIIVCTVYLFRHTILASSNIKIAILGDSLTFSGAWESFGWTNKYAAYITADLNVESAPIDNLAQPGYTSSQLKDYLQNNEGVRTSIANANLITLWTGFNDFYFARESYLNNQCGGADSQNCLRSMVLAFENNFSYLITEIHTLNSSQSTQFVSMTIYSPYVNQDQQNGSFNVLNSYLQQMNNFIKQTSQQESVLTADIYEAFNGPDGTQDPLQNNLLMPDGIHPNDEGHAVIADKIRALGYIQLDEDDDSVPTIGDNCPTTPNTSQENYNKEAQPLPSPFPYADITDPDGDNIGDACDDDKDSDRLSNTDEQTQGTNELNHDTDGDSYLDGAEVICGSNPLLKESVPNKPAGVLLTDSDNDLIPDSCESTIGSNPNIRDTDSDGFADGIEALRKGTSATNVDSDGDSCSDTVEIASVNADKTVNSADMGVVSNKFGQKIGDSGYSRQLDIDGNGTINSADLGLISPHFGEKCA